jgi:CMD domain protein
MTDTTDVINHLLGTVPGSTADGLRSRRPVTKENAQKTWDALFAPGNTSDVTVAERFAVAAFVAALHGDQAIAGFYADKLHGVEKGPALRQTIAALGELAAGQGPYGRYPDGPLTPENKEGPTLVIPEADRAVLGDRLAAALGHAHLLVFHPRDASPAALQQLLSAGWSTTGVVTLSQLVSFLAFQIRVVAGLKVLAAA